MRKLDPLLLGPLAFPWFFACTITLDALRPEYSFAHKAVSELGAIHAPYMAAMNLLGFFGTGAMLMGFGVAYTRHLGTAARFMAALLVASGGCFALTAIPIAMGADGNPDYGATSTQWHFAFSQLGVLPWIIALLAVWRRRDDPIYRPLAHLGGGVLVAFVGLFGALALGIGGSVPGLMQRLWIGAYLLWFAGAGVLLLRARTPVAPTPRSSSVKLEE